MEKRNPARRKNYYLQGILLERSGSAAVNKWGVQLRLKYIVQLNIMKAKGVFEFIYYRRWEVAKNCWQPAPAA